MHVKKTFVTATLALCAWLYGTPARAAATPAAPPPTARELTEDEKAVLNKLLFHTDAQPDEGPAPLTVRFSAEPFATDNPVNPKYVWDFGDGSAKGKGPNVTHTFKKPGKYKVVLKVTADADQAGGDDFEIVVTKPEK